MENKILEKGLRLKEIGLTLNRDTQTLTLLNNSLIITAIINLSLC